MPAKLTDSLYEKEIQEFMTHVEDVLNDSTQVANLKAEVRGRTLEDLEAETDMILAGNSSLHEHTRVRRFDN